MMTKKLTNKKIISEEIIFFEASHDECHYIFLRANLLAKYQGGAKFRYWARKVRSFFHPFRVTEDKRVRHHAGDESYKNGHQPHHQWRFQDEERHERLIVRQSKYSSDQLAKINFCMGYPPSPHLRQKFSHQSEQWRAIRDVRSHYRQPLQS